MANTGLGWFDPTYYGPSYVEDLKAINEGIEQGMQFGQMIGQNILKSKQLEVDLEERNRGKIADALALQKLDKATETGLILPADEVEANSIKDSRVDFSEKIVNKLNDLKKLRDNGQVTAADYAKGVSMLESQVGAFKSAEKVWLGKIDQYMEGIDAGNLSDTIDSKTKEFMSAMVRGDVNMEFNVTDSGKVEFLGNWITPDGKEEALQIALNRMEELPEILKKPKTKIDDQIKADVANIIDTKKANTGSKMVDGKFQPQIQEIYDEKGNVKEWVNTLAEESFDTYLKSLGQGDKAAGIKQYILDAANSVDKLALISSLGNKLGKKEDDLGLGLKTVGGGIDELKKANRLDEFIDDVLKPKWKEKTINAALNKNQEIIDQAEAAEKEAKLQQQKDAANAQKAQYQLESAKLDYAKKLKESTSKGNSIGLTQIYNQIMATPVGGLSRDPRELASSTDPYIDRIKSALQSGPEKYFIDLDEEGNYLLGKAGMKDQKKKRVIDPSRIKNVEFLMKEIAALNNETWKQPITVK
jgi:hypothetical protein